MVSCDEAIFDVRLSGMLSWKWVYLHMPGSRVFPFSLEMASQFIHSPVSLQWSVF